MQQERNTTRGADGTRLGRYRLGPEIGRGFSSIVYEALDTERGRTVALKVLTFFQHLSADRRQDLTERFTREARAISALAHPAIVAIYEFGQTEDGRWFTAMERLQGESLRSRLQRDGTLQAEDALPIAVQIAEALDYAHGRGVIHRDVKPDNIFLLPDGHAKLMDFGVAHVLSDQAITQTGTIVGSPAYMSPEQINGQTLDGRSDVFSLGVTLAEMLVGTKPFDAPTVPAVMHRILNRPPQLSAISPWGLRRVVAKALAKNRAARFGSAAALADALRRQGGPQLTVWEPTSSLLPQGTPLPLTYRSSPAPPVAAVKRRPVPPLAWVAAALAVVAMSAWPILTYHKQPVALHAPVGQVHTIPLTWRRVSSPPTPAAVPGRPRINRRVAGRIAETVPGPTPVLSRPASPAQPLPPAPPLTPARTSPPARTVRPGPQIALASRTAPTLPPVSAALRHPVVKIAGDRQEQQDLTPQAPDMLPSIPAPDQEPLPTPDSRDIPDAPPHLARRISPGYPDSARAQGQEGTVTLRVTVDEDGAVSAAEIAESSGVRALDRAALQAVRRWEYDPAFRGGAPVPGGTLERIVFKLD